MRTFYFAFLTLGPAERAAKVQAARKRIADAEAKRREARAEQQARRERQLAKIRKARKGS